MPTSRSGVMLLELIENRSKINVTILYILQCIFLKKKNFAIINQYYTYINFHFMRYIENEQN